MFLKGNGGITGIFKKTKNNKTREFIPVELEKCCNIISFGIIKSIEGEVKPPVFVKLLTKQYDKAYFFLQIFKYVFWQYQ